MARLTPDGQKIELKYLFEAYFKDGTIIKQNAEDTSVIDEGRSCFFDVMKEMEKGNQIVVFLLKGASAENPHIYKISLLDGTFEIDGLPFVLHEVALRDIRPLYFRVRDSHFSMALEYKGHEVGYRIGFQANDVHSGANIERYIEIR